jgi:hypothetical protein
MLTFSCGEYSGELLTEDDIIIAVSSGFRLKVETVVFRRRC